MEAIFLRVILVAILYMEYIKYNFFVNPLYIFFSSCNVVEEVLKYPSHLLSVYQSRIRFITCDILIYNIRQGVREKKITPAVLLICVHNKNRIIFSRTPRIKIPRKNVVNFYITVINIYYRLSRMILVLRYHMKIVKFLFYTNINIIDDPI